MMKGLGFLDGLRMDDVIIDCYPKKPNTAFRVSAVGVNGNLICFETGGDGSRSTFLAGPTMYLPLAWANVDQSFWYSFSFKKMSF